MSQKSLVTNIFESIDLNASPIGLRLYGDTSVKSLVGAFCSILAILGALFLSFEQFLDFIYYRKPFISVGTVYNSVSNHTTSINFNSSDLYFSLSIFVPSIRNGEYDFGRNNYSYVKYFSENKLQCLKCNENEFNYPMNFCNEEEFENMNIEGLPKSKAETVINLFKQNSFCIPDNLNGTIKDMNHEEFNISEKNENMYDKLLDIDSSLTLIIPFSDKTIEERGVKKNSKNNAINNQFKNSKFEKFKNQERVKDDYQKEDQLNGN